MKGIAVLTAALSILCAIGAGGVAAAQSDDGSEHVIQVSGTGTVTTTPDEVRISLGVETENPDLQVAQQKNAEIMDAVIMAIRDAGIPERDIRTTGYSIYHTTKDVKRSSIIPGEGKTFFHVSNTVVVTLKDTSRAGEIIDLAVEHGANRVNSIQFTLSRERQQELRSEALTRAVARARADADTVAAALGKRIVDVKEVSVGGSYPGAPVILAEKTLFAPDAAGGRVPTPIETGTLDVTAWVTITYIIG
ncbi:MAG: SIMPL domain-containing protein [Methanoculleaceae archaeon]